MNLRASENIRLFGMKFFFNEITNLYKLKKMPTKILLSGKKGLGKSTLAYHIVNYILSENEEYRYDFTKYIINKENKSFKLVQNNTHPNFYLIDLLNDKKNIDISQIRNAISYTNKSSFNVMPRLILIDNIETLNRNSVNALLKIIEEPNQNVYFILINNNEKLILPTLKSRCLTFNINFTFEQSMFVSSQILNSNLLDFINIELINYYTTPGEIINLINFSKEKNINLKNYTLINLLNHLIDNNYYKKDEFVKKLLFNCIELYFLKEYKTRKTKQKLLNFYHNFINKINNTKKFNLDEESLFLEFKSKLLNG